VTNLLMQYMDEFSGALDEVDTDSLYGNNRALRQMTYSNYVQFFFPEVRSELSK
jgi:hypothetical protein